MTPLWRQIQFELKLNVNHRQIHFFEGKTNLRKIVLDVSGFCCLNEYFPSFRQNS